MQDLIKALQIFAKYYTGTRWPTHCAHETLVIGGVSKDTMTTEDIAAVEALSFFWDECEECWYSFHFGSA